MSINDIFDIIFGFLMPGNDFEIKWKENIGEIPYIFTNQKSKMAEYKKQGQKLKSRYLRNQLRYWSEIWPAFISH